MFFFLVFLLSCKFMHELREGNNCAHIFARIDSSRPNIDQVWDFPSPV